MEPSSSSKPNAGQQKAAENALRGLIRKIVQQNFGPHLEKPLNLNLEITMNPDWQCEFSPSPEDQLLPQIQSAFSQLNVFRKGHVYCFQCNSSQCSHSNPQDVDDVFSGYNELGRPQWSSFSQFLLDQKDERIDQLYADPPRMLAFYSEGRHLQRRQLTSFGKETRTYFILGQVIFGYLAGISGNSKIKEEKPSITVQVVEVRNLKGQPELHLNLLIPEKIPDLWDRIQGNTNLLWITEGIKKARETLTEVSQALQRHPAHNLSGMTRSIERLLRHLRDDLQQGTRKKRKRTLHAQERRRIHRPVSTASEDVLTAPEDHFHHDRKTGAVIVLGPKGRCHVFNPEGKHVTSFHITGDAVENRIERKRWIPMNRLDQAGFLERFQNQT